MTPNELIIRREVSNASLLFAPECNHGIDFAGAAGGAIAREQDDSDDDHGNEGEDERVVGAESI